MTTVPSEATPVKAPRARLFYLDLVRALATVLIVVTHFNNPYLLNGPVVLMMDPFGIYIGDLGVSLFLVLSGAALMVAYGKRLELKTFYWKRFKTIYPMFWIAWLLATSFFILVRNGSPANVGPNWSFVFTLTAVDGMAANFGLPNMYLLGEWFLGFIVIFYLVFPLIRWGVVKYPIITAVVIALLYVASVLYFSTPRGYPSSIILTTRLPELAFGMYLAHYWKQLPWWTALPALYLLGTWTIARPLDDPNVATTVVGISAFVVLAVVARYLEFRPVRAVVGLIAKYSFAIFLVHHVVIMQLFDMVDPAGLTTRTQVYSVFVATSLVIFGLAVALFRLEQNVLKFSGDAFLGPRQATK